MSVTGFNRRRRELAAKKEVEDKTNKGTDKVTKKADKKPASKE